MTDFEKLQNLKEIINRERVFNYSLSDDDELIYFLNNGFTPEKKGSSRDAKIKRRLDKMLDVFSTLEIGIMLSFFPNQLDERNKEEVLRYLSAGHIKNYIIEEYLNLLPLNLLDRLTKDLIPEETYSEDYSLPLFLKFLNLRHLFVESKIDLLINEKHFDYGSYILKILTNPRFLETYIPDVESQTFEFDSDAFPTIEIFFSYIQFIRSVSDLLKNSSFRAMETALVYYFLKVIDLRRPNNQSLFRVVEQVYTHYLPIAQDIENMVDAVQRPKDRYHLDDLIFIYQDEVIGFDSIKIQFMRLIRTLIDMEEWEVVYS